MEAGDGEMLGCTVLADPGINYPLSNINTVPHHSGQRGHGAAIVHSILKWQRRRVQSVVGCFMSDVCNI